MAYTVYSNFSGAGQAPDLERIQKLEKSGSGQNLYTRIFRARAGSWSGAYTRYSKKLGPGRICILKNSVPGQVPGLERIQDTRKNWARAEPVYSKIQCPDRFRVWSVYKILEKTGPGQNLYTQKFSARAGSGSGAYTESSKSPGRICILKFSGLGQVPGLERIQDTRKNWARAEPVYSKIQCPDRFLVVGVYSILEFFRAGKAPDLERIQKARKVRARAESVYSNFSGSGRLLVRSVYKKLEKSGPGQNLYTQIFRARAGSWSGAYTIYSKSPGPGRTCILKFSGAGQAPDLERIQKLEKSGSGQNLYTRIFRARAGSWSGAYTRYSKKLGPGRICILKNSVPGQVPGLERIQDTRKNWAWAESVYSNFQDPGQALGRWRIQYTQIFRGRAGSGSGAYTRYSKKLGPGRTCILKNSVPGQIPGPERIQDTRKNWTRAESVYSNFQGQSRLLVPSVYRKLKEPGPGRTCILKNSVPGKAPDLERIQKARKVRAQTRFLLADVYSILKKPGSR